MPALHFLSNRKNSDQETQNLLLLGFLYSRNTHLKFLGYEHNTKASYLLATRLFVMVTVSGSSGNQKFN